MLWKRSPVVESLVVITTFDGDQMLVPVMTRLTAVSCVVLEEPTARGVNIACIHVHISR